MGSSKPHGARHGKPVSGARNWEDVVGKIEAHQSQRGGKDNDAAGAAMNALDRIRQGSYTL